MNFTSVLRRLPGPRGGGEAGQLGRWRRRRPLILRRRGVGAVEAVSLELVDLDVDVEVILTPRCILCIENC